jgi:hypothetical protein
MLVSEAALAPPTNAAPVQRSVHIERIHTSLHLQPLLGIAVLAMGAIPRHDIFQ